MEFNLHLRLYYAFNQLKQVPFDWLSGTKLSFADKEHRFGWRSYTLDSSCQGEGQRASPRGWDPTQAPFFCLHLCYPQFQ